MRSFDNYYIVLGETNSPEGGHMGESEEAGEEEEIEGEPEAEEPQRIPPVAPGAEARAAAEAEATIMSEVSGEKKEGQQSLGKLLPKRVVEAALFISSKPLTIEELGKFAGIAAPGFVEGLVKELAADYERSGSAVKIVFEPGGWIMRLRGEYAQKVAPLAQEAEVSHGALRILGYVSQNEGIEQSKVADRLGSTVYDYVHELVEKGFLTKEKRGRTSVLRTTQKFRDYFGQ